MRVVDVDDGAPRKSRDCVTIEAKRRYWKKVENAAPVVDCACGCGATTKAKDAYGREKRFLTGHNTRKYDDPTQFKREWNHRNRAARFSAKTRHCYRLKARLIAAAGSQCARGCGLVHDGKNGSCFDFHHRVPDEKTFGLNLAAFNRHGIAALELEAAKCDLLCSNCHRREHSADY